MGSSESKPSSKTLCPLGEQDCPISDQIKDLQSQVSRLSQQVRTDHLTGLYNNRHLFFSLEQEIERSQRSLLPTTLIMLDVDHFKKFNDTHGHMAGDAVLQHLSTMLKSHVRRLDIPCRYGGEEFAVILPSTPLMIGVQVAERLRASVAESQLEWNSIPLSITISLGVDVYASTSGESAQRFVERADKQLYRAKEAGRNCVKFHEIEAKEASVTADEKAALFAMVGQQTD